MRLDRLVAGSNDVWETLSERKTNSDGRVLDLLPPSALLEPCTYALTFDVGRYVEMNSLPVQLSFFPEATVKFDVVPGQVSRSLISFFCCYVSKGACMDGFFEGGG